MERLTTDSVRFPRTPLNKVEEKELELLAAEIRERLQGHKITWDGKRRRVQNVAVGWNKHGKIDVFYQFYQTVWVDAKECKEKVNEQASS